MKLFTTLLSIILATTGCASNPGLSNKEKNEAISAYVQSQELAPVKHVNNFRFSGWQSLTDNYLVLSSSPKRKYLIEVAGFCPDLNFSSAILVNQSLNSILNAKFDSIAVASSPRNKCLIEKIYPVSKEQIQHIVAINNNEQTQN